jgi:hypothetical protein
MAEYSAVEVLRGSGRAPVATGWAERGLCKGSGLDPFAADDETVEALKALCERCPDREPCQDLAMTTETLDGIWGGLTTEEREARRRAASLVGDPVRVEPDYMRDVRAKRALARGGALAGRRAKGLTRLG